VYSLKGNPRVKEGFFMPNVDSDSEGWLGSLGKRFLSQLSASMIDGFAYSQVIFDDKGNPVDYVFLEVNYAFERQTGLKRTEILGKRVTEVLSGIEKDRADWIGKYGKVALTGEPVKFEDYCGVLGKWFSVSAFSPKKGYFVAIFEDITERRNLEASVRESEERFRFALKNTPVIVGNLDTELRFTWIYNLQAGNRVEDLIGKPLGTGMIVENSDYFSKCFKETISQGKTARCEIKGRGPAGERVFDFYIEPKRDEQGKITGASFTALNITNLRKAEDELRKSEQRWATTLSSIGDAVIATDLSGKVTFMNKAATELTGWSLSDALQKPVKQVFKVINVNTRLAVDDPVAKVLKTGVVVSLANHTILVRKDGKEVPIDDSGAPIRSDEDQITGAVLVFRDVTEHKLAEDALRESEVKYRTVADFNCDWEYWIAPDGNFVYVSPSCERVTGYRADEFMKNPQLFTKIVHPEDKSKLGTHFDLLESDAQHDIDFRIVTRGGNVRWISHDCQAVFDDDGKWLGRRASNRDITDRKKNEDTLLKLNRHLRAISNSNQALMHASNEEKYKQQICDIIVNDCGYALVWVGFAENDEAKTVRPVVYAGFDKEYIDGLNVSWSPDTPRGRGPAGTVIRTGKPYVCRNIPEDPCFEPWRTEAVRRGYTASLALPLTSFEGVPFGVLSVYSKTVNPFSDEEITLLTELANDFAYGIMAIRLREERDASNEFMRKQAALIDLNPNATIMRKLDGTISFWSKGAEKLYGWTRDEVVGQNINAILKTQLPEPLDSIISQLKENGHWSGELVHFTRDGHEVVMQSYWLAMFDQDGGILELMESNVDVTDRKQMQTKLEEYTARLEDIVQERTKQLRDAERLTAIGETAGMVGHDLRNPLQTVTGETFLAKDELNHLPDSPAKRNLEENIGIIAEQIGYMDKIVSDLQDFVRPILPDKKPVDIAKLIAASLSQISLPKNVKAQTNIDESLPLVMADSQLLKRVFFNLLTNAVQAMPEGGKLTVNAYPKKIDKGKTNVVLEVEDTGEGIPEAIKPKIFRPLFTTKSKGQGFGLAVCRRVIEAHGGTIMFESREGQGTRFTLELPT
jgi:PAS domain S-box-containing protein